MIAPSDRAVRALEALGGLAPVEHVDAHLRWVYGDAGARYAIDLAVLRRVVERVELPDGRPGLRLARDRVPEATR